MSELDQGLEAARKQYGKLVALTVDGKTLAFRLMNRAKLQQLKKETNRAPDLSIDLSVGALKHLCVFGQEHFDDLSDRYPIAFVGSQDEPGVMQALLAQAGGQAVISVL